MTVSLDLRVRLVLFVGAIGLLCCLIWWLTMASWDRFKTLEDQLEVVVGQSFKLASDVQVKVRDLNILLLEVEIRGDTNLWARFLETNRAFATWLAAKRDAQPSEREIATLSQLILAHENYSAKAYAMATQRLRSGQAGEEAVKKIAELEDAAQELLDLGYELAEAHDQSLNQFMQESVGALGLLRWGLLGAFALMVGLGGWLAMFVYRELIAPLRVQLVEAQSLAERREKLAALGVLASGVAHEIRNPLTAIKARVFTLQRRLSEGSPEHDAAAVIDGEINRLERIVKDFLFFARPGEPERTEVSVGELLQEVQAFLSPQMEKADVRLEVAETMPVLMQMDAQQIRQVLINLIQNAATATGPGGRIILRSWRGQKRLEGRVQEVVVLEVEDNGSGIQPEVAKRLFDPFFTTKNDGTGLGLAIAARIVEKHGGTLQYQTQVGKGTTFDVVLPRQDSRSRSEASGAPTGSRT